MDPSFLDDVPGERGSDRSTFDTTKAFDSRTIYSPPPKENNNRNSTGNESGSEAFHIGARTVHFDDASSNRNTDKNLFPPTATMTSNTSNNNNNNVSAFPFFNISGASTSPNRHMNTTTTHSSNHSGITYPLLNPTTTTTTKISSSSTTVPDATRRSGFPPLPATHPTLSTSPYTSANGMNRNAPSMMSMMHESPITTSAARAGSDSSVYSGAGGGGGVRTAEDSTMRQRRSQPLDDPTCTALHASDADVPDARFTSFLARYVEQKKDYDQQERQYTTIGRYHHEPMYRAVQSSDAEGGPYAYVSHSEGRYNLSGVNNRQALSGLPQATFHSRHPPLFLFPELHRPGFCQRLLCSLFPQYVENPLEVYREKLAALNVAELSALLEMAIGEGEERQAALLVRELSRRRAAVSVAAAPTRMR